MTFALAISSTVLSALALAWNVWRWRSERPCLAASVEAVESFWNEDAFRCIRFVLRNRGGKQTTIEQITLFRRWNFNELGLDWILSWLSNEFRWSRNVGVSGPETVRLPVVLGINGFWEGYVPLEDSDDERKKGFGDSLMNQELMNALRSGLLCYSIHCSHTKRAQRGRVRVVEV